MNEDTHESGSVYLAFLGMNRLVAREHDMQMHAVNSSDYDV